MSNVNPTLSSLLNATSKELLEKKLPLFVEQMFKNDKLKHLPPNISNPNEERIYQFGLIQRGHRFLPLAQNLDRHVIDDGEIRGFWRDMQKKILMRKILNFGLLVDERQETNELLFFNQQNNILNFPTLIRANKIEDPMHIVFQKLLIYYTLREHGLSALEYTYQMIRGPKTKVMFALKDFVFELQLDVLVYLSPETRLVKGSESLTHFVSKLEAEEQQCVLSAFNNSIYETFLTDFVKYLNQKAMFNMRMIQNIYENSPEAKHVREGYLYLMKRGDKKLVYIIVTHVIDPVIQGCLIYDNQPGISLTNQVIDLSLDTDVAFYKVSFLKNPHTPSYVIDLG